MATLRLPGKDLSSVAWEGTGLRLAVGIGMHVYFANVRHDYQVSIIIITTTTTIIAIIIIIIIIILSSLY